MLYVLMALYEKDTFGTDIAAYIDEVTLGRVPMGPGTLYTILSKFEKDGLIQEIAVDGRKRTYAITALGIQIFEAEVRRLREVIRTAENVRRKHDENEN